MSDLFYDAAEEGDAIFCLLAAALVEQTWNPLPAGAGPGHNIGALLVDPDGQPVSWARNETSGRRNLTEHAELRLVQGAIDSHPERTELHNYRIYSTLEPCAMCAGAMLMTNVERVVYLQRDPLYGGAFERLATGDRPYPRTTSFAAAPESIASGIDSGYARSEVPEVIHWLPGEDARRCFEAASARLRNMQAQHAACEPVLESARAFLRQAG